MKPHVRQVIELIRANPLDPSAPLEQFRAQFEAVVGGAPVDPAIAMETARFGAVAGLRIRAPGVMAERSLLYFHGGGYVLGSPHASRGVAGELGRTLRAEAFSVDYRLAPEHPCPAAVEDGVAAYRHLLEEGRDPRRMVFAGDSAGGGLVVAVLVAARDAGLPMPAGAILLSPWLDLRLGGESLAHNADVDPTLSREGLGAFAAHYLGGRPPEDPMASPVLADLGGLAPILLQVGSTEVLLDDAAAFARAAGLAGVKVTLEIWPDMPHVWHGFTGLLPEADEARASARAFAEPLLE